MYDALAKARAAAARSAAEIHNDEVTALTQLAEGRAAEALKTIDGAALQATKEKLARSTLRYVEGLLALAGGNRESAVERFAACSSRLLYCKYREAVVRESVGDKTGADGAKRHILDAPTRDPEFLYVRAKMTGETKTR